MKGRHHSDKKLTGLYATTEERGLLKDAAVKAGFKTVADYLRWVARAQPQPGEMPADGEQAK